MLISSEEICYIGNWLNRISYKTCITEMFENLFSSNLNFSFKTYYRNKTFYIMNLFIKINEKCLQIQ